MSYPVDKDVRRRGTILVVDGDEATGEILAELLEDMGFEVVVALDGAAGLNMTSSSPVDLVLTDIDMPWMDGLELVARLRARKPAVKAIVMTGNGALGTRR